MDNWTESEVEDSDSGIVRIEDDCDGEDMMEEKENEKYLGYVLSNDGRNITNIKARVKKGTGIVRKILTLLEQPPC